MSCSINDSPRRRGLALWHLLPIGLLASLALPAVAFASDKLNDPTAAEYDSTSSKVAGGGDGASQIGGLPFTGLDIVILVVGAALLIATGLLLRRLSRPSDAR